jgi:hypothetical protein
MSVNAIQMSVSKETEETIIDSLNRKVFYSNIKKHITDAGGNAIEDLYQTIPIYDF